MAMYKGEAKIKDIYVGTEPIVKVYAGEEFCGFFTLSAYNIVANSDLLLDSNSDAVPDNFSLAGATAQSLVNGVFTGIATVQFGRIQQYITYDIGDTIYYFSNVKADSNSVKLSNNYYIIASHSGSNSFEFLSGIKTMSNEIKIISVRDDRASGWTPVEVDYIGAINITDLVSRGILPSGLTNAQYKTILDNYFNS